MQKSKEIIVDANVILRFLTADVAELARKAKEFFKKAEEGKHKVIIFPITIAEVVFHLENWYKISREEIFSSLFLFLSPPWIIIPEKNAVLKALEDYKKYKKIDFVDLLLWNFSKELKKELFSFDKDFERLKKKD